MEKETSTLVGLGVVLIAIAVVISIGFGSLQVGKRLANSGQNDLVTSIDYAESQKLDEYNSTVVTGMQISSNLSAFINSKDLTIMINTLDLNKSVEEGVAVTGEIAKAPDKYNYVIIDTGYSEKVFVNYGKLVENSFSKEIDSDYRFVGSTDDIEILELDDGKVTLPELRRDTRFTDISSVVSNGTMHLKDGSKFNSYLLNDAAGVTCGIIFEQIE